MTVALLFFLLLLGLTSESFSTHIGINYGQLGDNLPPPSRSIELTKYLNMSSVKIYDANPAVLEALRGTSLKVSIMVPNQAIVNISASKSAAHAWVQTNLLPLHRRVRIRTLPVGNEVLSDHANQATWFHLVPAMHNIERAFNVLRIPKVKVSTTFAMDTLESSFPPSLGIFRRDIAIPVVLPLLKFLHKTRSSFFIDVYPYFAWSANPDLIPLDYALFCSTKPAYIDPVNGLRYTNLLDQMLDSVVAAMAKLGFKNVPITVAETGWPNAGDLDQIGANIENAAVYNRNLARHLAARVGTPARPGMPIRTYLFALYNKDRKDGPEIERHWGLYHPNGSAVYEVDMMGKRPDSAYRPLPKATNNQPYLGKIWCMADPGAVGRGANARRVTEAVRFACSQGNRTCEEMRPGKNCFLPRTPVAHASYAFNAYWQQFRRSGATCYFGGLAFQTATDPSYGSCAYPASSS